MRWLTGEQQRMWRDYLQLTDRLRAAMARQLQADCGMSLADYDVLVVLSERDAPRITDLAGALGWEQSRLSHQLRRMRARGLIERHGDDDDRRGATVALTPGGSEALAAAAPGHAELVRSVLFDGLTAEQQRVLGDVLTTVLGRLPS
ncbi:MarR family winged helix-turn-helix transcriptional regulator [Mycolicibacterium vaccae]|uniref:MarR family winged helix-turn-helix transcriptional regulator n=1 Tax=Mycolicibacterium vaccae TaxID=1810 RepID=UPI003D0919E2